MLNPSDYFPHALWLEMRSVFNSVADGWRRDSISPNCTNREEGYFKHPKGSIRCPPALKDFLWKEVMAKLPYVKGGFKWFFENKFYRKLGARNARSAAAVARQFNNLRPDWSTKPKVSFNDVDVIDTLGEDLGLYPLPTMGKRMIFPPHDQARMGLHIALDKSEWYMGPKGPLWSFAMDEACEVWGLLEREGLSWRDVESSNDCGRKIGFALARRFGWCFIPAWRLDGGFEKLRLLLIGDIAMYIVETWWWGACHREITNSAYCGDRPKQVRKWFQSRYGPCISADVSGLDQSEQPLGLLAVYKAVCTYFGLSEPVGVALFLYNSYTPAMIAGYDELGYYGVALVERNGQAASGIGGFPNGNTLYVRTASRTVMRRLTGVYRREQNKGDDHVVPSQVGVKAYVDAMWSMHGLVLDPKQTKMSPDFAIFLRRFFNFGEDSPCVDLMSRFRNACFPEMPDPWNMHPIRRAISLRAQSIEVVTSSHVPASLIHSWLTLFPTELWDEHHWGTDQQLCRTYKSLIESGIISRSLELDAELLEEKLGMNRAWI